MNLYFVTCQFDGVWRNFAYWADCANDATNQAIYDGATQASTCPTPADPSYAVQYHGPDFGGREAYCVTPCFGDSFFIAADTHADAVSLAASFVGSMAFHLEWLLETEAAELLEPGWDQ